MCGKNKIFTGQKRQSVHDEGNNALSSQRRSAVSCDPSVGYKVESQLKQLKISKRGTVSPHVLLTQSFSASIKTLKKGLSKQKYVFFFTSIKHKSPFLSTPNAA